ncbi:MAG: hypothetical protein AAGI91_13810 [Bacteroidota bacterium]
MAPLRSVLRLALVLCLVLSTQGLLLVQGAFLLRQDFVIEHLCVNRGMPELECEGTCFLTRQLHEQRERQEERNAASVEVLLTLGWFFGEGVALPDPPTHDRAYTSDPSPLPAAAFASNVFRPPRA